jgi:hypothetical protein
MAHDVKHALIHNYGFEWGAADVIRTISDQRFGNLLSIVTDRERMDIRVTPAGRISVHHHAKPARKKTRKG